MNFSIFKPQEAFNELMAFESRNMPEEIKRNKIIDMHVRKSTMQGNKTGYMCDFLVLKQYKQQYTIYVNMYLDLFRR
jgi:hypothetical protein